MEKQDTVDPIVELETKLDDLETKLVELESALHFLRQVNNSCRDKLSVWINSRVPGLSTEAYQQVREVRNAIADALQRTKKV